jgi:cobalamin biosynthesis protein CbiG
MAERYDPPGAPNLKQDFTEAAKQQAKKEVPFPSEKGISTKAEIDKRVEMQRILREKMERENPHPPPPPPIGSIAKNAAEKKFKENKKAYEENEATKEQIAQRLRQKKDQQMHREFNKVADRSID